MKGILATLGLFAGPLFLLGIALTAATGSSSAATSALPGKGGGPAVGAAGSSTPVAPGSGASAGPISPSAAHAVAYAEEMIGVPYLYGGNGPGGFDCSGLVWAAYAGTPSAFPRWGAAEEFTGTPPLLAGVPLTPGDLVFFADSGGIEHVGIYVGTTTAGEPVMIDAPHTGATVRYDTFSAVIGAAWGDEYYAGATAPGGL